MHARLLIDYALNAAWQAPLIAAAAWIFLRAARFGPLGEHRVWLAVLLLCVTLPARGVHQPMLAEPATTQSASPSGTTFANQGLAPVETVFAEPQPGTSSYAVPQLPASAVIAPRTSETPWHLRSARLSLTHRTIRLLAAFYVAIILFALVRLTRGWLSARRLLAGSTGYTLTETEAAVWHELGGKLGVRLPPLLCSTGIGSPVVVGLIHPTLLLPETFRAYPPAQQRAALAHELAHIQRHDCLTHAVAQVIALPLVWHPILHAVETRIARTREMICDRIAAREMRSEVAYARCLLALAQGMLNPNAPEFASQELEMTLGLFRTSKLEERVMKLTEMTPVLSTRAAIARRATGLAMLGAAVATAAIFHLTPVLAQTVAPAPPTAPAPISVDAPPVEAPAIKTPTMPPAPPAPIQAVLPAPSPAPMPAPAPAPALQPQGAPALVPDGEDLVIAHGRHAHVIVRDGGHVHRWIGHDGQPFEIVNDQAADLTPAQQLKAEAEYTREKAKADAEIASLKLQLNSPEFKSQIDSGQINKETAHMQADLARQLATFKIQADGLANGDMAKQLADVQIEIDKQLAELKSDDFHSRTRKQIDDTLAQISNQQMLKQIAGLDGNLAALNSHSLARKLAETQRKLDEANKRLDEANRQLAEDKKRLGDQPHP